MLVSNTIRFLIQIFDFFFGRKAFLITFASLLSKWGAIAQLVEQRTENPCVPSSILGGATKAQRNLSFFFSPLFSYLSNDYSILDF